MDPLATSTALATVVGLICNFRQEKGASEALDHQKFIEWLEYHRHDDIKNLITNTYNLQDEVNRLLRADHSEIIARLNTINEALTSVLSHISEFSVLAKQLGTTSALSDQAVSILQQFAGSKATEFVHFQVEVGSILALTSGDGNIPFDDERFVTDDIQSLAALGFISLTRYNSSGNPIYSLTRNGARYAELTKKSSTKL
jgi:hypothetical protein